MGLRREDLARMIVDGRTRHGLSQIEFGRQVGVSNQQISRWERGAQLPRSAHLARIAEVLSLDLAALASLVADAAQEEVELVRRDRDRYLVEIKTIIPLMRQALDRFDQVERERTSNRPRPD